MTGGHRDAAEQAEAHRTLALGMMAGRAGGDESVLDVAVEHAVDRLQRAADAAQDDLPGGGLHHGVAVEVDIALVGALGLKVVDIGVGVDVARDVKRRDFGVFAREIAEGVLRQHLLHRPVAVRPLGMARRGLVIGKARMVQQECGHRRSLSRFNRGGGDTVLVWNATLPSGSEASVGMTGVLGGGVALLRHGRCASGSG